MQELGYEYDDGGREAAGFRGKTGDCLTRAVAIVTGQPYRAVYEGVAALMKQHGHAASGNAYKQRRKKQRGQRSAANVQRDFLLASGFVKVDLPDGPRPTYEEAHRKYGDCVVTTTKHFAALKGGALRDTFDGRTYEMNRIITDFDGSLASIDTVQERKAISVYVLKGDQAPATEPCPEEPALAAQAAPEPAKVKTPIEVPDGVWRGHLIRRARKAGQCEYWRGMRNGGQCKKPINPGDFYMEGDIKPGSYWGNYRYCKDCVADEMAMVGLGGEPATAKKAKAGDPCVVCGDPLSWEVDIGRGKHYDCLTKGKEETEPEKAPEGIDTSDIPPLTDAFFKNATLRMPKRERN